MNRAFLVVGPESSGTRLVTQLLIAGGCIGDHGHEQKYDHEFPQASQWPLVWRRSFPHAKKWPELHEMVKRCRRRQFKPHFVVTMRDEHSMIASQLNNDHVKFAAQAKSNIRRAYELIFNYLGTAEHVPMTLVSYENLVADDSRQARIRALADELYLDKRGMSSVEIYDANVKHYAPV